MLSRLLEHYPTQWLKVTILEHPLKIQVTLISLGDCHIRFLKKIKKKKTELGETEATCTSCTETTATTAVSQDAASSTIERLVNRSSSSERCTPLSGIGKKLKQRKASEASRATGDLLQQRRCRDELKNSSALSAIGPSGKSCSPGLVTLTLRHCHLFNIFCWQYCDIWRAFYSQGLRCVRFGREARSSFPFRAFLRFAPATHRQAILENRA